MRLFPFAALALLFAMALPVRAADDRPVKQRVAPVYPEIAKRMHVAGEVKLQATVDASGKVIEVKTLSGNHMLSMAAEDAVRKWKFESGAGEAHVAVAVNFNAGQ
ncbi:MAG: energy transducer TonB [Terracidiphilus sp.]|nr:energy transducer TonB [Terracidiphilus sp.]